MKPPSYSRINTVTYIKFVGFIRCLVNFMQQFNVSGCQKTVLETNGYAPTKLECPNIFVEVSIGGQNCNFSFPLISENNIYDSNAEMEN